MYVAYKSVLVLFSFAYVW